MMEPKGIVAASSPQWISVEDRLPGKSGVYIIRSSTGAVYTDHFYHFTHYPGHFTQRGNTRVTHWMPLPAPPKEQKKRGLK